MTTRRAVLVGTGSVALCGLLGHSAAAAPAASSFMTRLRQIERRSGGRLGVTVLDTRSGQQSGWRMNERFPMCSTFKLIAAAAVLRRVDRGAERLDRRVVVRHSDIITYSPVTKERIGQAGITIAELCEAAVTLSDNTAANLILKSLGGPRAITAFAHSLGDRATRLDRIEPFLNSAIPGDRRDTTTPAAMAKTIRTLVLGDALSAASRAQLVAWLRGNKTGDTRLRAGLPEGWICGDKTGTGVRGTSNDIGVLWPPQQREPLVVTAYLTGSTGDAKARDAVLADVARAVVEMAG
ncbi:MAG TPA: class A beta-lactamase [Pseudolabrys sp.]